METSTRHSLHWPGSSAQSQGDHSLGLCVDVTFPFAQLLLANTGCHSGPVAGFLFSSSTFLYTTDDHLFLGAWLVKAVLPMQKSVYFLVIFRSVSILFSIMAVLICSLIDSVVGFPCFAYISLSVIFFLFHDSHSNRSKMVLHCSFNSRFLDNCWCWAFFSHTLFWPFVFLCWSLCPHPFF